MNRITIAFSSHRPETLAYTASMMDRHDTIFLEEPPAPGFSDMLKERLAVDTYVMESGTEYPEYGMRLCRLLQKQFREGKTVAQVEPFLEILLEIHEHFANGGRPEEIAERSPFRAVYAAEKLATGRLINFYDIAMDGSFADVLKAVKSFARADAARFRLRDTMRAVAIAGGLPRAGRIFIEAGDMHQTLPSELRQRLPAGSRVKIEYLMEPVVRPLTGKRQLLGPGDILTLHYLFRPEAESAKLEILAARSLIYSKIIAKEELPDKDGNFPHINNEWACIRQVRRLSMGDCAKLYPHIRRVGTLHAADIVKQFLKKRVL